MMDKINVNAACHKSTWQLALPNKAEAHRQSPSPYKSARCAPLSHYCHPFAGRFSIVVTNIHEHAWCTFCREKAVGPDVQITLEALFGKIRCLSCASKFHAKSHYCRLLERFNN